MKLKFSDAHCDTGSRILDNNENLYENSGHLDLKRLIMQNFHIQFMAAFVSPEFSESPYKRCTDIIKKIINEAKCNKIPIIKNESDVECGGFLISVEDGAALEGDIEKLYKLYKLGVRAVTLTWNGKNELGDGAGVLNGGGLTPFGKQVVSEMNKMGMLVDVSHLSDKGFFDVSKISDKAFIASHSNARALCENKRNLTDEQIKEIIKRQGYIGINFYPVFLNNNKRASVYDIIRHIEYIMSLGGEKVLGFGADFDGVDFLPDGITGVEGMEIVKNELLKLNYSENCIDCIMYKNLKNVIKNTLLKKTIVNL